MSYSLVNKPAVILDILEVVDYYKKINPKLATNFLDRIDEARHYIANFPTSFQIKYKNDRTALLTQVAT